MNIVTIIGARPQFIKAAVVSNALKGKGISEKIVHTGQHYDPSMSDVFFKELNLPKEDINLQIGSDGHGVQTGKIMIALEQYLLSLKEKINYVLVYGDTNSTLAGALVASKLHIPVIHIEAGLRSNNNRMPEEINRILTDHISTLLFCPSSGAVKNLEKEGIVNNVYNVGDVMGDAILYAKNKILYSELERVDKLGLEPQNYCLATIHRAENTDNINNIKNIFEGFAYSEKKILLALHPRTKSVLSKVSLTIPNNVRIIEPLGYLDMIACIKNAHMVISDSGGIQKEAYWLDVPCVTMRDETEWVETVEQNRNILTGADSFKIAYALLEWKPSSLYSQLYNYGSATANIVDFISSYHRGNVQ